MPVQRNELMGVISQAHERFGKIVMIRTVELNGCSKQTAKGD